MTFTEEATAALPVVVGQYDAPQAVEGFQHFKIYAKSETAFSITYRGCYWFAEYNPAREYEPTPSAGDWVLTRDPRRREPPSNYVLLASGLHWFFRDDAQLQEDLGRLLFLIAADFESIATERKGMHRRKKRLK